MVFSISSGAIFIYEDIDVWQRQREIVFGTGSIQVLIIHTHSYLSILLRDRHNVGHPLRVSSYHQETSVELLFHLLLDL